MSESQPIGLRITKSVRKDLIDLQPKFFKQVISKILLLAEEPRPQDYKQLLSLSAFRGMNALPALAIASIYNANA